MNVQQYLDFKGFQSRRQGEEFRCVCPFCKDSEQSFSVNLITGVWQCFRGSCGLSGNFYELQKKLGDRPVKLDKPNIYEKKKEYILPSQDYPKMDEKQKLVYEWLKGRGFKDETIKYFRLGAKENTVILPYFKNGVLVNKKNRDIINKHNMSQDKNAEPTLFNRDNIDSDTLIITEGECDTIAMHQYGLETVSVPNGCTAMSWVDNEWDFLETFKEIIICFDNDAAGQKGANELAKKLGLWRTSISTLPYKDANECLMKGVGASEIFNALENAKKLSPETIMKPMEFSEGVQYLFEQGNNLFGIPTAWEGLTKLLKGWRGSEVTVWTGRNGSGKSTILNQHVLDLGYKGQKTCIYSGEMPADRYLRWAVIQFLKNSNPTKEEVVRAMQWMEGKIYILNVSSSIETTKLISDFEYAARRYGVKHFIIDSLMKVKLPSADEYEEQKNFMNQLCDFVKKHNCHMNLVVHPRKTMSDKDEPGKVDVKGSSHLTDLAHNVIVMYRLDDEAKDKERKKGARVYDTKVFLKKNREFGDEGIIKLIFSPETRNFTGIEEVKF